MKSCHGANVISGFHTATCLFNFIFYLCLIVASFSKMFPFVLLLYRTEYIEVPVVYWGLSALQRNDHSIKWFGGKQLAVT